MEKKTVIDALLENSGHGTRYEDICSAFHAGAFMERFGVAKPPFRDLLFSYQPHEIVQDIFDYFGSALLTAPPEKVEEFRANFCDGVMKALASYRRASDA